jgi:hypothetical protein
MAHRSLGTAARRFILRRYSNGSRASLISGYFDAHFCDHNTILLQAGHHTENSDGCSGDRLKCIDR